MTVRIRVIPCLDVADGRVVKGVNFVDLKDAGDPVEQARAYDAAGADELCFLDISASHEGRGTLLDIVRRTAEVCFMPLTVGGGVRTVEDARALLLAGADKVAINSAAVARPELVREIAEKFGSQCVVASVDARRVILPVGEATPYWEIFTHGGRKADRHQCGGICQTGRRSGRGRTAGDEHGRRRHAERLRPRTHPRDRRCGKRAGDCQRRGRHARSSGRRRDEGPCQRRSGRQHISLWHLFHQRCARCFASGRLARARRLIQHRANGHTDPP